MELLSNENRNYSLVFNGKGSTLFGISIVNWLLTLLTLGLYYPWAKARVLNFMYRATVFNGEQFEFLGSGKEMFIGMLKSLLIILVMLSVCFSFALIDQLIPGIIILYLMFFAFMPLAIHGSYRYRMSRTSWRGIRFGYRGDKWVLFFNFFKWVFLTIITLGLYSAWMSVKMQTYIYGNLRAGDAKFKFEASGLDLFIILIKGYVLTLVTLGVYFFWWQKELFEFQVNNMTVQRDEKTINFRSKATAGDFFKLIAGNVLILIFTLGFGFAWAEVRYMRFVCNKIELNGNINPDKISQTEEDYKDATADGMADFLDIDFVL